MVIKVKNQNYFLTQKVVNRNNKLTPLRIVIFFLINNQNQLIPNVPNYCYQVPTVLYYYSFIDLLSWMW